jgi:hypothetical protein
MYERFALDTRQQPLTKSNVPQIDQLEFSSFSTSLLRMGYAVVKNPNNFIV